jgi:hypothetical protein
MTLIVMTLLLVMCVTDDASGNMNTHGASFGESKEANSEVLFISYGKFVFTGLFLAVTRLD